MSECCGGSAGCWVICILCAVAWWLFASGLLLCAWNSVVASIANVKKAKYWHALVVVLTLVVLCGPLCCGGDMCVGAWCGSNCGDREEYGRCRGAAGRCGGKSCCDSARYRGCGSWDTPVATPTQADKKPGE